MNKHKLVLLMAVSWALIHAEDEPKPASAVSPKKKILILTSFGGGGTLTASRTMEDYLQDSYEVESKYVFKELLEPLDPFSLFTFGHYSSEEFYNLLVPGKFFTLLGWVYVLGTWYVQIQKNAIYMLLRDYCIKTKPDLIISVVPVVNNILLEVTQDLTIPFLLMPTDLDVSPYIVKINHPTYKQFYLGLAFDDNDVMAPINNAAIPQENILIVGSPLRKDFFIPKNKYHLRRKYNFDQNKFTIMLLMGSQGSNETEKYVAELLKLTEPVHIVACIGKNEESRANISRLAVPAHISLSVVGFTPHIVDYMAMSDLLLSKSGTLSVYEALYMDLPMFLDATSAVLPWEKFNFKFVKKHDFGTSIQDYSQIVPFVTECIKNPYQLQQYKENIRKLDKKDFPSEIRKVINKILSDESF